jgi:hypothetical protein
MKTPKDHAAIIARQVLNIDLTPANHDNEDFHEIHVASLRRVIQAAYDAGRAAGSKGRPNQN